MSDDWHDLEARLVDATRAATDHVEPAPDAFAQLRSRVADDAQARARRRRGFIAGGAMLAAAAAIGGVIALSRPDELAVRTDKPANSTTVSAPSSGTVSTVVSTVPSTTSTSSTSEPTSSSAATTTTTTAPVADDAMYAYLVGERLFFAGTSITIGDINAVSDFAPTISLAPDHGMIYRDIEDSASCASEPYRSKVQAIAVSGGMVRSLGRGRWPTVSSDGALLAYVQGQCDGSAQLIVVDRRSGEARNFPVPEPTDGGPANELVGPISFEPGTHRLLLPVNREPGRDWWIVDADANTDVLEPTVVRLFGEEPPTDLVFAAGGIVAGNERDLVLLDDNGNIVRTLATDSYGEMIRLAPIDADASGRYVVARRVEGADDWAIIDTQTGEVNVLWSAANLVAPVRAVSL